MSYKRKMKRKNLPHNPRQVNLADITHYPLGNQRPADANYYGLIKQDKTVCKAIRNAGVMFYD